MYKSLSKTINTKLAIYLVLVVSIFTFLGFFLISNILKNNSVATLMQYTKERSRYESKLFVDAQKSFKLMEEQFFKIRNQHKTNGFDYESRFKELFPLRADGKIGPRVGFSAQNLNKEPGGAVSVDYKLNTLIKEVLVDSYSMIHNLGNAWKPYVDSTYIINSQYIIVLQPSDFVIQVTPKFDYTKMDVIQFGLPENNPKKKFVGLIFTMSHLQTIV